MNRRYALTGIGTLLLGGLTRASSPSETGNSATFVLVHGAWHGGWCWKKVAALLRKEGFVVYAPTLSGLGERSHQLGPEIDLDVHIQDIVNVLEYEDLHHVILVGHSYAGMVITGVAGKAGNRIDQLVYLDAFLPENGKSLSDYVPAAPAENTPQDSDGNWKVPPLDTVHGRAVGSNYGPRLHQAPGLEHGCTRRLCGHHQHAAHDDLFHEQHALRGPGRSHDG